MPCDRVVIINDFSLARGGATALALLSAKLFREKDIPVTLFCGDTPNTSELAQLGIDIVSVGGKPLLEQGTRSAMLNGLWNRKAKQALDLLIAEKDTAQTIYHVHAWSLILSPSIFSSLQKVAKRVVIHSHDQFLACPNGAFFDFQKGVSCQRKPLGLSCLTTQCDKRSFLHKGWRVSRQAMLSRVLNDSLPWGAIALIHPMLEERLKSFGYKNTNMVSIRNPVDPFAKDRVQAEQNDRFFFVGRVEPDKGVLELVNAAAVAQVPLTIVGDGPLVPELQKSHPDVHFAGWCDKEEIGALMQTARALVMPSRFAEPFGLVAVEAIQSGVPVIVAQDAFLASEITENALGLSCNIHDETKFAAALQEMHGMTKETVREMSEKGFANTVPLALHPDTWRDELLNLFASLVE